MVRIPYSIGGVLGFIVQPKVTVRWLVCLTVDLGRAQRCLSVRAEVGVGAEGALQLARRTRASAEDEPSSVV
ncbi:hypothetical protein GCM10023323_39770 [Streptomyces thinghirensis]|uniref:Uncharacterized protein n=1 Tax=Streptomyces thinghirensis TaxID=551547 RepID=A0ABP9T508_9ACTN